MKGSNDAIQGGCCLPLEFLSYMISLLLGLMIMLTFIFVCLLWDEFYFYVRNHLLISFFAKKSSWAPG